jgi:hypothetical protein
VSAFLPRAIVRVWAGMTELLAEEQPELSYAVLKLKRPVKTGEFLTTTQEAGWAGERPGFDVTVPKDNQDQLKNPEPQAAAQRYGPRGWKRRSIIFNFEDIDSRSRVHLTTELYHQLRSTFIFFVRPHLLHASDSSSNAPPNRIGAIRVIPISVPHLGHVDEAISGGNSSRATRFPFT